MVIKGALAYEMARGSATDPHRKSFSFLVGSAELRECAVTE
jgi:hypothetical protein